MYTARDNELSKVHDRFIYNFKKGKSDLGRLIEEMRYVPKRLLQFCVARFFFSGGEFCDLAFFLNAFCGN